MQLRFSPPFKILGHKTGTKPKCLNGTGHKKLKVREQKKKKKGCIEFQYLIGLCLRNCNNCITKMINIFEVMPKNIFIISNIVRKKKKVLYLIRLKTINFLNTLRHWLLINNKFPRHFKYSLYYSNFELFALAQFPIIYWVAWS